MIVVKIASEVAVVPLLLVVQCLGHIHEDTLMSVFSRKSWVGAQLGVKVKGYAAKSLGNVNSSWGVVMVSQ